MNTKDYKKEIENENNLIESYFSNKDALNKNEIQEFYSLYNNDFLFKERADLYNAKNAEKKEETLVKPINIRYLMLSIAASVTLLLMFSFYFINMQKSLNNKIVLQQNNMLNLETIVSKKNDSIKNLFTQNIKTKDKLSELKQINEELKKGSANRSNQIAQLIHYKNRVQQGAFTPDKNFTYNTKGNENEKIIISPAENEMYAINRPVVFKWKYDKNISELRIYDNDNNQLFKYKINNVSAFKFTEKLDFGTYYWKLKYSTKQKAKSGSFQVHY